MSVNRKEIVEAMKKRVGFKQSNDPTDSRLDNSVTQSDSGLVVNAANDQYLTTKNMDALLVNYDNNIEKWLAGSYDENTIVIDNNIYFTAKIDTSEIPNSTGKFWNADIGATVGDVIYFDSKTYTCDITTKSNPLEVPANFTDISNNWTPTSKVNTLSDQLFQFRNGAINRFLTEMLTERINAGESKPLIDSFDLYTKIGYKISNEIKTGRRVGLEICLVNKRAAFFVLKSLATIFNGQFDFNIQIHSPNQKNPVIEIPISQIKTSGFQFTDLIDSENLKFGTSQVYDDIIGSNFIYISYLESDIPPAIEAITRRLNNSDFSLGCNNCDSDVKRWGFSGVSKYFDVTPFYVNAEDLPTIPTEMWDLEKMVRTSGTNFGLSFTCSIECDETRVILENINIFDAAIQYQTAMSVLRAFTGSTRINGTADQALGFTKENIMYDIEQEESQFLKEYSAVMEAMTGQLKNIEWPCLVKKNQLGISWGRS